MRDKLRCYASQLQFGCGERKTPAYQIEDYVANAKKAVSEGYDAINDFLHFRSEDTAIALRRQQECLIHIMSML